MLNKGIVELYSNNIQINKIINFRYFKYFIQYLNKIINYTFYIYSKPSKTSIFYINNKLYKNGKEIITIYYVLNFTVNQMEILMNGNINLRI